MKIAIDDLKHQIHGFLTSAGMNEQDAGIFTELVIEQELIGNQFSPVGELRGKHERLVENVSDAKVEVVVDKPSAMLVKGNGRLAPLITMDYLDKIIVKAKQQGIYAFGIYDSTYNEFFDIYCRKLAAQDCVAIIFENGGPQGVVPFGGKKDVTGTNPLAYGIPTNVWPIIFDGATAEHAWGRITQAKERGEKLPDNAYLDGDGAVTTDPHKSVAILPFGGYKGWAINLLVDVLSGALVRGRSGLDQPLDSQRYIGTFVVVIDPACFGDIEEFKVATTKLANDILASPPADPANPVRVPGYRGAERREQALKTGSIEIADEDWRKFKRDAE